MKIRIYDYENDRSVDLELTASQWKDLQAFLKELKNPPDQDYKSVLECYNRICTRLPPATKLTDKRRRAIVRAQKDGYDFEQLFRKVAASPFLNGRNSRKWRANFDWLMQPSNLVKVSEGQFSDGDPVQQTTAPMTGNPFDEYG